uniref:Kinesin-like protein 6 n=1 Tax=Phallusia mammillata TaxID=59560 RepID=A0A6F9DGG7_9ASCI|nr:kinesin-like protein KIF28P [Phallusia mammillata]
MPSNGSDSIKVAVRVRPFNEREKSKDSKCAISMRGNTTTITNPNTGETKDFTFDRSYWSHDGFRELDNGQLVRDGDHSPYVDQDRVFEDLGQGVLNNAWDGYNATLFAYGQTGSGKSYSMIGDKVNRGIVPQACGELFQAIEKQDSAKAKELQVSFSILEIYNEQIRDLLANKKQNLGAGTLKVRERGDKRFYVEGLSHHPCRDYATIKRLMKVGAVNRSTAATNMNATSSRSHMVITIKFSQIFNNEVGESTTKTSEINLVDLAGSERAKSTGATGDRLKEGSAINKSLLNLGTVIEALASGKSQKFVPYRDSVLTQLLKSALGGNSKTVMIAAISPADVNYEETLSTLRYADRAKKIKNQAVVNESPTDKLIRELKEENAKLLKMLSGHSTNGFDNDKIKELISQNELQLRDMSLSWEQKLEQARKEWEAEQQRTEQSINVHDTFPYMQNVNEDPQLSGVIKYVIRKGSTVIGRCQDLDNSRQKRIVLQGLGIQEEHCTLVSQDGKVTLKPLSRSQVTVNGDPLTRSQVLHNGDRLKIGSNALFLYIGFPEERTGDANVKKRYDYQFFQKELASKLAPSNNLNNNKDNQAAFLQMYMEYIELMPVVAGVNAMSEEMEREVEFTLQVKNLATRDEAGRDLPKDIIVRVKNKITNQVWIWSKTKFNNRRYMIEELYMNYQEDSTCLKGLTNDNDPFWDPVEDIYLGCAYVWLCGLAHYLHVEEQAAFYDYYGEEVGLVELKMAPCLRNGQLLDDSALVHDPSELLGKPFSCKLEIDRCMGLRWIKENNTRGVMLKYTFYNQHPSLQTQALWCTFNPKLNHTQQLIVDLVDKGFLQYLEECALVIELWGLQAGRNADSAEPNRDSGLIMMADSDFSSVPSSPMLDGQLNDFDTAEKEVALLRKQLQTTLKANEQLKTKCSALKKENKKIRKSLSCRDKLSDMRETPDSANRQRAVTSGTRVQAELGRALKEFFGDIRPVQHNLKIIHQRAPPNGDLKALSRDLDEALTNLRSAVALAVQIHKEERNTET